MGNGSGENVGGVIQEKPRKLTLEELSAEIKNSIGVYNLMVEYGAVYFKLYGELPKIGLSGQQGEFIKQRVGMLPDKKE